jgi:hypothetical protein
MPALSKQDAIVKVRLTTTKRLAEDLQNGTKPQDIDIDLTFGQLSKGRLRANAAKVPPSLHRHRK